MDGVLRGMRGGRWAERGAKKSGTSWETKRSE